MLSLSERPSASDVGKSRSALFPCRFEKISAASHPSCDGHGHIVIVVAVLRLLLSLVCDMIHAATCNSSQPELVFISQFGACTSPVSDNLSSRPRTFTKRYPIPPTLQLQASHRLQLNSMYVCMYVCNVCMYGCVYVCIYSCMYVCLRVCMSACMYVCMYVMECGVGKGNVL